MSIRRIRRCSKVLRLEDLNIKTMFKKNQFVLIDNKLGKIVEVQRDCEGFRTYTVEIDGFTCVYYELKLTPAPKTFATLEVGDVIVNDNGNEAKVLEVGETSFLMSDWCDFKETGVWLTFTQSKKYNWKIKGTEEETLTIENKIYPKEEALKALSKLEV